MLDSLFGFVVQVILLVTILLSGLATLDLSFSGLGVDPTGKILVLAGILARQVDELREAYAPWCMLDVTDSEEGWVLMTATAGGPP